MKGHILLFVLLWIFYMMLTGFNPEEIVIGGVLALIISFSVHYSFTHGERTGYVKAFLGLIAFVPYYIFEEIKANLKVIYMIITGRINPGFVEVSNHHKNEWGTATLSNAITMTPGTLTVDVLEGRLLIHCLNKNIKKKDISGGFDHFLKKVWD
ncbi:MAG: Na+/H+ antiporter subunit E [Candidatus Aenigmarchaeota archaeon]|nr:Na+/H+ antiporter subunit E [Candidatus Aenigmarchaeota archaeon]